MPDKLLRFCLLLRAVAVINLTDDNLKDELGARKGYLSMPPKMPKERAKRKQEGKIFTDFEREALGRLHALEREFAKRQDLRGIFDQVKERIAKKHDLEACIQTLTNALKIPPVDLSPLEDRSDADRPTALDMKHNRQRVSTYQYVPPAKHQAKLAKSQTTPGVSHFGIPPVQTVHSQQPLTPLGQGSSTTQQTFVTAAPVGPTGATALQQTHIHTTQQTTQTFIQPVTAQQLNYPPSLQQFKSAPLPTSANSPLVQALQALSQHVAAATQNKQQSTQSSHSSQRLSPSQLRAQYHVNGVAEPGKKSHVINHQDPSSSSAPPPSTQTRNFSYSHGASGVPVPYEPAQPHSHSNLTPASLSHSTSSSHAGHTHPRSQATTSENSRDNRFDLPPPAKRSRITLGHGTPQSDHVVKKGLVRMGRNISPESRRLMRLIRDDRSREAKDATEAIVDALYSQSRLPCSTCGFRVKDQEALTKHLDWHFQVKSAAKAFRDAGKLESRRWYQSKHDWDRNFDEDAQIQKEIDEMKHANDSSKKRKADSQREEVPADSFHKKCQICGEPFEEKYSDNLDQWVFEGAVRTLMDNQIMVVHQACHDSEISKKPRRFVGESPSSRSSLLDSPPSNSMTDIAQSPRSSHSLPSPRSQGSPFPSPTLPHPKAPITSIQGSSSSSSQPSSTVIARPQNPESNSPSTPPATVDVSMSPKSRSNPSQAPSISSSHSQKQDQTRSTSKSQPEIVDLQNEIIKPEAKKPRAKKPQRQIVIDLS